MNVIRNQTGSLGMKIGVVSVALFIIFGVVFGSWWIKSSNAEIRLRNKVEAQEQVIEAFFDKMWKIIKQQAGVAKRARFIWQNL